VSARRGWSLVTVKLVRERAPADAPEGTLHGPGDVARLMHHLTDDEPRETFWCFYLNTRHRVTAAHMVTAGILDASLIHPREVFRGAIVAGAAGVIVAHNHPSGDPTPSPEDRAVTRQLAAAGKTVGIPLLDHIVTAHGGTWRSLSDDGALLDAVARRLKA